MEITIPGALADFLAGTNLATGADDHDPTSRATREALDAGRRGRGRTLIIRPTVDVLHVISEYAETLLASDEATRAERRAARLWIERAGHARPRPATTKQATDAAPVIVRADEVRPGDTVLACFGDDFTVDTATEAHAIEHAEPYTAAPAPYNPACDCTACATYKTHEDPLVNLATNTPWETCDPAPADAPTLIRRQTANVVNPAEAQAARERSHRAAERVRTNPDPTDPEWRAALAELSAALDHEREVSPIACEAIDAAELVTEAEAAAGTWRGEWIGEQQTDDALFAVKQDAEQGALFAHRPTE